MAHELENLNDIPVMSRVLRVSAADVGVLPCRCFDVVDTRKPIAGHLA